MVGPGLDDAPLVKHVDAVRVLLKVDEGSEGPAWADARTAEALEVASGTVAGIRRRFCERGLTSCVKRKSPDREYDRKLDGEQEAELIRLACLEAPEGRSQWSLRLLADRMVELNVVEDLSTKQCDKRLKKPTQAPSESPMGDSARARCELRREDGGRALCLEAHGDGSKAEDQNRLGPLHETPP